MCIRLGSGKTHLCINNMKQDPRVRRAAKSVRATGSGPAGSGGSNGILLGALSGFISWSLGVSGFILSEQEADWLWLLPGHAAPVERELSRIVHTIPGQALIGCRQGIGWPTGSACSHGLMVETCDVSPTTSTWAEKGAPQMTRRRVGKRASQPPSGCLACCACEHLQL